jgi:acid phosphatase
MPLRLPATLLAFVLLAGCAATSPRQPEAAAATATAAPVAANDNLNAVAWTQTAIEHDLIYLQTYRDAEADLLAALKDPNRDALAKDDRVAPLDGLKPAVVLDIDETVLDNSPYQARLVRSGGEYNEADWAAWCREEAARALPGAVEFTQFAASHGIAVIYISNRARDLDQVTLANLRKAGLPVSGPGAFLGLGTVVDGCEQVGTEKGCRRQLVSRKYRVLMQFGDQLGDFVTVRANTAEGRRRAVAPYLGWIGTRWFVLPNPTYGAWEPALFDNDWAAPPEERRRRKIETLRVE